MRIFLDARYLDGTFSGIGTYSAKLIESLAKVDEDNEYYVLVQPGFQGSLDVGENFTFLTHASRPVSLQTMFSLGKYVDSLNVDLMHSFFPIAPLFMKTPLAITLHDLQPLIDPDFSGHRLLPFQWLYNSFYKITYPAVMRRAKWIIPVSYYTSDCVAELFPDMIAKLFVCQSGMDEQKEEDPTFISGEEIRSRYGLKHRYLLYYGSTRPNKNIPMMLKAFARYRQKNDDQETEFVLILKKDRFFRDIQKMIKSEGLGDHVRVFDQVVNEDQKALLADASVFMFATKYEGFGFPPLEAMVANVPVIAGDSGALPEVCGDAAEWADPDDADSIADAIEKLLTNDKRCELLIEKGKTRVTQFDWITCAEKIRDAYRLLF